MYNNISLLPEEYRRKLNDRRRLKIFSIIIIIVLIAFICTIIISTVLINIPMNEKELLEEENNSYIEKVEKLNIYKMKYKILKNEEELYNTITEGYPDFDIYYFNTANSVINGISIIKFNILKDDSGEFYSDIKAAADTFDKVSIWMDVLESLEIYSDITCTETNSNETETTFSLKCYVKE